MGISRAFFLVSLLLALGCGRAGAPKEAPGKAQAGAMQAGGEPGVPAPLPRKIIYNATVDLVVDHLATAEQRLDELIRAHKGILARAEISTAPGAPRTGRWTARVPVDEFAAFMKAVVTLGELQKSKTDSDDVTEEFYDLDGRIKNLKAEEETLRKLLKDSVNLQERLAVREQLQRVTSDMERLEGKLKRLDNLASLSTVTVNISERKGYVPSGEPSFGTSIARTFHGSLELLGDLGRAIVLIGVAIVPWLPVALLVALPVVLLIRRRRRLRAQRQNQPPPEVVVPLPPESGA
jgi:hypothetical protein